MSVHYDNATLQVGQLVVISPVVSGLPATSFSWRSLRVLPGGLHLNDSGCILGTANTTTAMQAYTIVATLRSNPASSIGAPIWITVNAQSQNNGPCVCMCALPDLSAGDSGSFWTEYWSTVTNWQASLILTAVICGALLYIIASGVWLYRVANRSIWSVVFGSEAEPSADGDDAKEGVPDEKASPDERKRDADSKKTMSFLGLFGSKRKPREKTEPICENRGLGYCVLVLLHLWNLASVATWAVLLFMWLAARSSVDAFVIVMGMTQKESDRKSLTSRKKDARFGGVLVLMPTVSAVSVLWFDQGKTHILDVMVPFAYWLLFCLQICIIFSLASFLKLPRARQDFIRQLFERSTRVVSTPKPVSATLTFRFMHRMQSLVRPVDAAPDEPCCGLCSRCYCMCLKRMHKGNIVAFGTMLLEFWQLSAITFTTPAPWSSAGAGGGSFSVFQKVVATHRVVLTHSQIVSIGLAVFPVSASFEISFIIASSIALVALAALHAEIASSFVGNDTKALLQKVAQATPRVVRFLFDGLLLLLLSPLIKALPCSSSKCVVLGLSSSVFRCCRRVCHDCDAQCCLLHSRARRFHLVCAAHAWCCFLYRRAAR